MTTKDEIFKKLYDRAVARSGYDIVPCNGKTWGECLTEWDGQWVFWYNVRIGTGYTTRVEKEVVSENRQ